MLTTTIPEIAAAQNAKLHASQGYICLQHLQVTPSTSGCLLIEAVLEHLLDLDAWLPQHFLMQLLPAGG